MAILRKIGESKKNVLRSYHLIGRLNKKCDLVINASDCSRVHASIEYKEKSWLFSDVSSNGTLVNERLVNRSSVVLKKGDTLQFSTASGNKYEVINIDKPCAYLIDANEEEIVFISDNFLELVDDTNSLLIYGIMDNLWVFEGNAQSKLLSNGSKINSYKGKDWTFVLNEVPELTKVATTLPKYLKFYFEVSPNYEHVSVHIEIDYEKLKLPTKAMNYTFYLLAKQMEKDIANENYSEQELGWISCEKLVNNLQRELGKSSVDIYYLNVQVYRIRKSFSETPYGPLLNGLIERRTGQIRFKHPDISIKEYSFGNA